MPENSSTHRAVDGLTGVTSADSTQTGWERRAQHGTEVGRSGIETRQQLQTELSTGVLGSTGMVAGSHWSDSHLK